MSKRAIVLGGTNAHIPLLVKLKARGFYTILVDYLENPIAKHLADEHVIESTLDFEKVKQITRQKNATLIISTSIDQANLTVCYVAEQLGLPAPYSYETARNVTDKLLMKKIMLENLIPTAKYKEVSNQADAHNLDIKFPLIVKPADNCGSKGVRKVNNSAELEKHLTEAICLSRNRKALIEEFLHGREIVADCFVKNHKVHIISIYEKFNIISPKTVVQCFRSIRPVTISPSADLNLRQICQRIANAFNLNNTSLFVQTIVDGDDVKVIEFAPRVAGGLAYRATLLSTGFDAIDATLDTFLGIQTEISFHSADAYYTTNSIYGFQGTFCKVAGYTNLIERGVIEEFSHYKTTGMCVSPNLTSSDRIGGFIVKAASKDELFAKTEIAMDSLEILNGDIKCAMIKNLFKGIKEEHIIDNKAY